MFYRTTKAEWLPLTALVLLALQNFSSVTEISKLQHYVQSRPANGERFNPLVGIVVVEILKLTICIVLLLYGISVGSVQDTVFTRRPIHWDAAWPALLYTLATVLQSAGAYNLDLVAYLALSQIKIILAPLFTTIVFKKQYPLRGWLYVFMMMLGIILCQTSAPENLSRRDAAKPVESAALLRGTVSMFLAGICVALGSIFMERAIKRSGSLLVCNIQLAGYSVLFALLYFTWMTRSGFASLFSGFNAAVIVYLGLQVLGGFLVAWCVQMSSTVSKNYAQGVGFALAISLPLAWCQEHVKTQVRYMRSYHIETVGSYKLGYSWSVTCAELSAWFGTFSREDSTKDRNEGKQKSPA
ncbi:nucleotide-sugar transporter-domain-containing protein [Aspergillus spinulosporus]